MSTIPAARYREATLDHGAHRSRQRVMRAVGRLLVLRTRRRLLAPKLEKVTADRPEFLAAGRYRQADDDAGRHQGEAQTVSSFHQELVKIMCDRSALRATARPPRRADFPRARGVLQKRNVPGSDAAIPSARKAGRVSYFLELGELICSTRSIGDESCGSFRTEYRRPTARRCARREVRVRLGMGSMSKPGSRAAHESPTSNTCTGPSELSDDPPEVGGRAGPNAAGRMELPSPTQSRHVVPRDARHRQRPLTWTAGSYRVQHDARGSRLVRAMINGVAHGR